MATSNTPASITLRYDERLARRAVFTFWRQILGIGFFVALIVLTAAVAYSLIHGDRGWFAGATATVLALGLVMMPLTFLTHYRSSVRRLRAMRPPEATLTMTEQGFSLSSSIASSSVQWSAGKELWETPDFWLVFLSSAQFITLPTADVSGDALDFFKRTQWQQGRKSNERPAQD